MGNVVEKTRLKTLFLSLLAFVILSCASLSAYSQTESGVGADVSVQIPVVQVGSEFYRIVLEQQDINWKVTVATLVEQPQSISGIYQGTQLTILCLRYEGTLYEIKMGLLEAEEDSILFELLSLSEKSGCEDIAPVAAGEWFGFNEELVFVKYAIENALQREAICNDGSEAAYYFRPSQTGSRDWKIHLQGGGNCSTETSCQQRTLATADNVTNSAGEEVFLALTSSRDYPEQLDREGVFSLSQQLNPVFSRYNHVYIPYCSSDSHYGDRAASEETFGFHFRGKKIITAVTEDLKKTHIIGENNLATSERVVISGTSAGGRGVQQNLDRMAEIIGHDLVFGVLDSSYFDRFFLTEQERVGLSRRESTLWNGQYDESCVAVLGEDKHLCDRVELMSEYISTPLFIHMDQYDSTAVGEHTDRADQLAAHLRTQLSSTCGVFSGQFGFHGAIRNDENFFESRIAGLSYYDVLSNWLFGSDAETKVAIEGGAIGACMQ